jgi:cell wall-associated NlpC family hydrolase
MRVLHLGVLILLAVATGACAARSAGGSMPTPRPFPGAPLPPVATAPEPPPVLAAPPASAALPASPVASAVDTALKFLGVPYRNGGSDPSGFDCSGFVQYVFNSLGIKLPREVRDQWGVGENVKLEDVRAGDLLFFQTVNRGASHVGMAIGPGQFVHAPSSRGVVRVERYTGQYWASRFVGARRLPTTASASAAGRLHQSSQSSR